MITRKYDITGMSCAACSASVEKVTGRIEGVAFSSVNLSTGILMATFDENLVTDEDIIKKVERAGFGASLHVDETIRERHRAEENRNSDRREKRRRLTTNICLSVVLLYISMGQMLPIPLPVPDFISMEYAPFAYALSQLILTIFILINGRSFFVSGYPKLFLGHPNMDSLVALGTSASFVYSLVMTVRVPFDDMAVHNLYYESAALVVTLVMLGKYLEDRAKGKTGEAVRALKELFPETAAVISSSDFTGEVSVVELEEISTGMHLCIRPGERIPLDGVISAGETSIDESMITGESIPVDRTIGDAVVGGSMNCQGSIIVEVTHTGADTTLAEIIRLMEDAQASKAPICRMADTVAGVFVPIVLVIASVSALAWLILGYGIALALNIFVSVLVIACPCALGLATPTAIMASTGNAASSGILFKSGEALETLHGCDVIMLDKTGTITEGSPAVNAISCDIDENDFLSLASSVENASEHPLSRAICDLAKSRKLPMIPLTQIESISGKGIRGVISSGENSMVYAGNRRYMEELKLKIGKYGSIADEYASIGMTPIFVARSDCGVLGVIGISDTIKETSAAAVARFKKLGLRVVMLTGDNEKTASHVAEQVGITDTVSGILPQDKASIVKSYKDKGHKVIMVGDGINDAPSLETSDCGIAIGSGSDIAIESASVVLMKSDLYDVVRALRISRLTIRNIKQNLFWAFFYNILGIPLAAGLFYIVSGHLLSPSIAGLAMSLSSVTVVSNALRLCNMRM